MPDPDDGYQLRYLDPIHQDVGLYGYQFAGSINAAEAAPGWEDAEAIARYQYLLTDAACGSGIVCCDMPDDARKV